MTSHFENEQEFAEAIDFLMRNTNFPSFEQFAKDPDKWRNQEEDLFVAIEQMNVFFKDRVKNVRYYWRGVHRCDTLERLQYITREEGYKGSDLEMQPIVEPTDGSSNHHTSKMDIRVQNGAEVEALVAQVIKTPQSVLDRTAHILKWK